MPDAFIQSIGPDTMQQSLGSFSVSGTGSFSNQESTTLTLFTNNLSNMIPLSGLIRIKGSIRFTGTASWNSYSANFITFMRVGIGPNTNNYLTLIANVAGPLPHSGNTPIPFDMTIPIDHYCLCANSLCIAFNTNQSNGTYYAGNMLAVQAYGGNGSVRGSLSATCDGTIEILKAI